MTDLPGWTVTLLFSDIEGSTMLLSRLGPEYAEALDGQRVVLRDAWSAPRDRERARRPREPGHLRAQQRLHAAQHGPVDDAAGVMRTLIPGFLEANEPPLLMVLAEDLASVLAFREPEQAVQPVSAAEGLRERLATPRRAEQDGKLAAALASTHVALDEAQWQQAYRAGRDATIEDLLQGHRTE